jgi:type II restriction enzyme
LTNKTNGQQAEKKIKEALAILNDLGLPMQQQNERSALTLLSLLGLKPSNKWEDASDPLMGITPMMDFFQEHYGKRYAPNTRETVRRQTVHQFLQAALIVANPDKPSRPTNSPKAVYQIEPAVLKLLRGFGKPGWKNKLSSYLRTVDTLKKLYAREREMRRLPVKVSTGQEIRLSPGGQNVLVKKIIEDFCPLFTPGSHVIYVGDTKMKWAYFDSDGLSRLGVNIEEHGKMPDIVVYYAEKNWLILIEAVTSHGPVNAKRRQELKVLFSGSTAGLVFVTAFLDRKAMVKYLNDISWETEVWIAGSPTHLIHFNGERFLGPYQD